MDEDQKREIHGLVHGHWNPMLKISPRMGLVNRWIWRLYYILLSLWFFELLSGFFILGFIAIGVGYFVYRKVRVVPFARLCDLHNRELCVWCQYPLTDLPEEGLCPECGGGYRKELCRILYRFAFYGFEVEPNGVRAKIKKYKWLWARAIRERDRVRDE